MSVKEIETAISKLSPQEKEQLHAWMSEQLAGTDGDLWLEEITRRGRENFTPMPDGRRPFGLAKGTFTVPDDFDTAFSEEIIRMFEGE